MVEHYEKEDQELFEQWEECLNHPELRSIISCGDLCRGGDLDRSCDLGTAKRETYS